MTVVRRVALGAAKLTLSNVFVRLLSVISMPILTRLLEPSAYGSAAMAAGIVSFVAVIALAGADVSYIRAYFSEQIAPRKAVEAFTWQYSMGAALIAAALLELNWGPISRVLSLPAYAGWIVSASIVFNVAFQMGTARARLRDRYLTLSLTTIFAGVAYTATALGLAYLGWRDGLPLLAAMLAGYFVPVLFLGIPPIPTLVRSSGLSQAVRRHVFGIGLPAIIAAPAYALMTSLDRWLLGYYQDASLAGIYTVGYSVAIVGMTVNNAGLYIWTPEATKLYEARTPEAMRQLGSISEAMIASLACVWLAITAAGGDTVRLLTAPAFHQGAAVVPFIAGAVFFHGIIHIANTAYILEKRVYRTVPWWTGGVVVCLLLTTALVPSTGIVGAAIGQLSAFAFTGIGLFVGAWQLLATHINWRRISFIMTIVLAAAAVMTPPWVEQPLMSLLLKFPAGLFAVLIIASAFGVTSHLTVAFSRIAFRGPRNSGSPASPDTHKAKHCLTGAAAEIEHRGRLKL